MIQNNETFVPVNEISAQILFQKKKRPKRSKNNAID